MKKTALILSLTMAILFTASTHSYALVYYVNDLGTTPIEGSYATPQGWDVIASRGTQALGHDYYYTWGLVDLPSFRTAYEVNIIFHGLTNWRPEETFLSVYLFDGGPTGLRIIDKDSSDTSSPDTFPWVLTNSLGTWQHTWTDGESLDVVFTTDNPLLLAYLNNGNYFRIGIAPDCAFTASSITFEANAPVPEPMTLMLLGSGLLGLAAFRKRS
jgi:hypothetical protein